MPSFSDSIFLFILALLLFGPKRLPVLARELGKWVGEFRRASNEFKMQMEDELRQVEQADRQKQIAAMEAAAPVAPALPASVEDFQTPNIQTPASPTVTFETNPYTEPVTASEPEYESTPEPAPEPASEPTPAPLPIATSGELSIMPPSTGLPTARGSRDSALSSLLNSIPEAPAPDASPTETTAHGN